MQARGTTRSEMMALLFKTSAITLFVTVLLGGLAAGCNSPIVTSQAMPAEGSAEAKFARAMSTHHAQAVEMSLNLRDRTTNPELRTLMLDIILTQQNQIGQMTGWLNIWGLPFNAPSAAEHTNHGTEHASTHMLGMAAQHDVNSLKTLPISEAEVVFLKLMIVHHEGGIKMAEEAVASATRPEVRRLAEAIVRSQQNEIDFMQSLLAQRK